MRRFALLAALLLAAPAMSADPPKKDDKKKDDPTTKVTGTFTIPKEQASFEKLTLVIELFEYDPKVADQRAESVEKLEVKDFKHEMGKETVQKFEVGAKGMIKEGKGYYLTIYVMDGDSRVVRGDLEHDKGLGKVLTNGQPREVKATAFQIKSK